MYIGSFNLILDFFCKNDTFPIGISQKCLHSEVQDILINIYAKFDLPASFQQPHSNRQKSESGEKKNQKVGRGLLLLSQKLTKE